jgi:hypothetical protein
VDWLRLKVLGMVIPRYPYPSKLYQPLNRCAYCGSIGKLSKEHIIPFGLGSDLILPKGSCEDHRKATSNVENFVLRKYLCPLRSYLSLPSRKPHLRPNRYPLTLKRGPYTWKQTVKLSAHPGVVQFIMFEGPPGRVAGLPQERETFSIRPIRTVIFPDMAIRLARLGADTAVDRVVLNAMMLVRMIAKVAHSFAVAELGIDAFEETISRT